MAKRLSPSIFTKAVRKNHSKTVNVSAVLTLAGPAQFLGRFGPGANVSALRRLYGNSRNANICNRLIGVNRVCWVTVQHFKADMD